MGSSSSLYQGGSIAPTTVVITTGVVGSTPADTGSSLYQEGSQVPVGVTTIVGATGDSGFAVPIQTVTGTGAVVLDYDEGKHVVLNLTGNITSLAFTNWPVSGNFARMTVEVHNTGAFTIAGYDSAIKWGFGGTEPDITQGAGAIDWLAFTTTDSGTSLTGHYVGQNYL